ncbi:MAG: monovalent cation/H+ antiporter subunit D family protein [Desulfosarcina sp.]|nr:monovalent cation/H+ antiporter subunit D family protein [Desulfobacterales bacterium]
MTAHYPVLIIVVPLVAAFLVTIAGWIDKRFCFPLAAAALLAVLLISVGLLFEVQQGGPVEYFLAGWTPPVGIGLRVDHLNVIVLVAVAAVAFLNLVGTRPIVEETYADRLGAFYTLYILLVTGLMGITATGDAFNLYVLLEIAALTGYALIGMGEGRAPLSSLNYIFMGTIGASFYLLGVGYLYLATGTLNMADLAARLPEVYGSRVVVSGFIMCLAGLCLKMGFFPLHAWLPNAYSHAPSPVSSLVAPLMTKVMVYVMIRMVLFVFTPAFAFAYLQLNGPMVWLAVIAIVAGSLLALSTRRLKRMLTYIIVAEVGYMVGGFWLGNRAGMSGAILHIVNDAAMTFCVFLAAAALLHKNEGDTIDDLQGMFTKMPVTMAAFVVAGLSIIGVPPTCGFFSKWYLISGGIAAGQYGFVAALLFSSLINLVLFFRIFEIAYFEPFSAPHGSHGHGAVHGTAVQEAPLQMLVPLVTSALLLVALGLYAGDIVELFVVQVIPTGIR